MVLLARDQIMFKAITAPKPRKPKQHTYVPTEDSKRFNEGNAQLHASTSQAQHALIKASMKRFNRKMRNIHNVKAGGYQPTNSPSKWHTNATPS